MECAPAEQRLVRLVSTYNLYPFIFSKLDEKFHFEGFSDLKNNEQENGIHNQYSNFF